MALVVVGYLLIGFVVALVWMAMNYDWILEEKRRQRRQFAGIGKAMRVFFLWPVALLTGGMRVR